MASSLPDQVDTVIVGNGPSALILSYILHGHIPYYRGEHYDAILHKKLTERPNLLQLSPDLYAHFQSSLRYSTQALPVNILLDTLLRPNADTEVDPESCIEWRNEPLKAVSHIALGNGPTPGGQWADNPVAASWDIGTLSYAEMLSLPGYTFAKHYEQTYGTPLPDFVRPTRRQVADYFAAYPSAVGIAESIYNGIDVKGVSRTKDGFYLASHGIHCKHLVLASGIFSKPIPPPPTLRPLLALPASDARYLRGSETKRPLLVIGSGFTAADIIISAPPSQHILHLYRWAPDSRPSPLKGCHYQAYPEYAGIYRQMKLAAIRSGSQDVLTPAPLKRKRQKSYFSGAGSRDWADTYEGLPNAQILKVQMQPDQEHAVVEIQLDSGETVVREVSGLEYVVGRRGSLSYLSKALRASVLGFNPVEQETSRGNDDIEGDLISGRTLREKVEKDLEVSSGVFIMGSLTGDSLIRFAFGGSVYAAGRIMETQAGNIQADQNGSTRTGNSEIGLGPSPVQKVDFTNGVPSPASSSPRARGSPPLQWHPPTPIYLSESTAASREEALQPLDLS